MTIKISLPNGDVREYPSGVTGAQIANDISEGLARNALGIIVNDVMYDLSRPITTDAMVRIVTFSDEEGREIFWHSTAHLMAEALESLYPGVKFGIGPPIENGFYYDVDLPGEKKLSIDDLPAIEKKMAELVKRDAPYQRIEISWDDAVAYFTEKQDEYKLELLDGLKGQEVTFYRQGEFTDLCRGTHVPSTGIIKYPKLLSVAGAYWRGDVSRKMLTRIYGVAFPKKQMLEEFIQQREEAERRDHRKLGKELEIYTITPMVGGGLPVWLPNGTILRRTLENFLRTEQKKRGYQEVITPHIGNLELYKTSGHYPYYADSQYDPITVEDEQYLLKPMNCPHHIMIYKSKPRSYRDLPLRLAEFGTVYRFEQSGELNGMTRVRGFTQDDAHLFCTEDQVAEEFHGCIEMTQHVLRTLGMSNYRVRLGFRDPKSDKYVGSMESWNKAEAALESVCRGLNLPDMSVERGEAAFYGPKADFVVTDCIGREWQLGTVQLDYILPSEQRFALEYIGADNTPHRPVMIHRAPLGSFERFVGVLIEHFAGAFPLWLAPEQVRVLVVSQKFEEYARQVEAQLKAAGLRVTGDYRPEKIGAKIRDAQLKLVPYMFVVGGREMEQGGVAVRDRIDGDIGFLELPAALAKLKDEIAARTVRQVAAPAAAAKAAVEENQY